MQAQNTSTTFYSCSGFRTKHGFLALERNMQHDRAKSSRSLSLASHARTPANPASQELRFCNSEGSQSERTELSDDIAVTLRYHGGFMQSTDERFLPLNEDCLQLNEERLDEAHNFTKNDWMKQT
jgi:hypothetical protein